MSRLTTRLNVTNDKDAPREVSGTDLPNNKRGLDVVSSLGSVYDLTSAAWGALTVDDTPDYSAGDQFGELVTLTNVPARGFITGIEVQDDDLLRPDLNAYFFGALPTLTSVDNGALNIAEASLDLRIARLRVRLGHWDGNSNGSHYVAQVSLPDSENGGWIPYQLDSGATTMYLLFQAASSINVASSGAFRFRPKIIGM